uniref:Uncharacterized protein n=1 Tax=Arundo donax TaxID=35708 RepID=A0A0A9AL40_ARUDO
MKEALLEIMEALAQVKNANSLY